MSAGSAGSVEAGGTGGSLMTWPGEGGLARCQEDELWPPRVFSITAAWMDEGCRRERGGGGGGGVAVGE